MERTKVSPELCRAFEEYFPQVKSLTEEIQESYDKTFNKPGLLKWSMEVVKNNICRKIGAIKLSPAFSELGESLPTLPPLKFWKDGDKPNPSFYLITSIHGEILYIGTSEKTGDDSILSQSVSAVTGGILPVTETKQAYSLYLGLLCAVKHYGICYVYEIPTGLENVKIADQYSNDITKEVKCAAAKTIYRKLLDAYKDEHGKLPPLNAGVPLFANIHKIWKYVSTFKTMVENGLVKVEEVEVNEPLKTNEEFFALSRMKDFEGLKESFEKSKELMSNKKFWKQVEAAKLLNELDIEKIQELFDSMTDGDKMLFIEDMAEK